MAAGGAPSGAAFRLLVPQRLDRVELRGAPCREEANTAPIPAENTNDNSLMAGLNRQGTCTRSAMELPSGRIEPLGYVVMQHGMRENRPPKAYQRWIDRFPAAYRESVLDEENVPYIRAADDPYCLAMLKHYRSLMPMAMEARKPVFSLKPSDGAIGAHGEAVRNAYDDFLMLARRIADRCGAVLR